MDRVTDKLSDIEQGAQDNRLRSLRHKYEGSHAEYVQMTGVMGMHSVIYDAKGVPLEVRVLPARPGRKVGPYKLREEWCTYGRLTWSIPEPITDTARCVMNSASRQIQERNKLRAAATTVERK